MTGKRGCEVCNAGGQDLIDLQLDVRTVTLCRRHAARAREAGARSLSDIRRLFVEASGQRSLVSRRGAEPRRALPARPEGRRLVTRGRRSGDPGSDKKGTE